MQETKEDFVIRLATMADVEPLASLLSILFEQEADFSPDTACQTRALRLIIGNREIGQIYCAIDDDHIAGMASILFTISTAEGGRAAWLEDMVVHPSKRGGGIGERLLQAAIEGARSAGCSRITLLTDSVNEGAMRFYSRAGFARSPMTPMRLKL